MTAPAWAGPTFPDYPPTVGNAVAVAADSWGDHQFVVTPDDALTYAQLDRRSRHLAARLVEAGVTKGDKVAVLFPNSPAWVISPYWPRNCAACSRQSSQPKWRKKTRITGRTAQ